MSFTVRDGKQLISVNRSMSVGRSALALSVLTISSGWHDEYADFFIGISKIEPIFHLESVVMTLDDARPEKKFTLLLIKLAKARA